MNWTAPVDIYCERVSPEFWAEPWNAASNAAFIIAALWAWRTMRNTGTQSPILVALTALAFCIGIGSFLFHTYANAWSELADTLPIWTFVAVYIMACIHIRAGVPPRRIAIIALGIAAAVIVGTLAFDTADTAQATQASWSNGSEQYLPAVIALLVLSVLSLKRNHPLRYWFVSATAIFIVSLGFRTVDLHTCEALHVGTHFMWHILNGVMIALLLQALIRHRAAHP